MKTKTINLYEIRELSKEAFERAKKEYDGCDILSEIKNDGFYDFAKETILRDYGLDIELQYILRYSQGDGLSFKCDDMLSNYMIEHIKKNLKEKKNKIIFKLILDNGLTFKSNPNNNGYCYASKNDIEYDFYEYDLFKDYIDEHPRSKLNEEDFENCVNIILENIQDWYMTTCGEYEKQGYAEIYYQMSNEEFIELCEENELLFLENGERYE